MVGVVRMRVAEAHRRPARAAAHRLERHERVQRQREQVGRGEERLLLRNTWLLLLLLLLMLLSSGREEVPDGLYAADEALRGPVVVVVLRGLRGLVAAARPRATSSGVALHR